MYRITVKYGMDKIDKTYDNPPTARQVRTDLNVRAALGYGDNSKLLLAGVEMPDEAVLPSGSEVVIETRANQKAILELAELAA